MSGPRGYSSYHGRSPVWKWLLIVLLILIILAAGAYLVIQNYLVYDANGVAHLELPWQTEEEAPPPSSDQEPSPEEEPDDLVIQEPERKTPQVTRGVALSGDTALWQTAVSGLAAAGQNSFAVTVKEGGGKVNYASTVAQKDALSQTAAQVSALLPTLLAGETHAVARLSCFRDEFYSTANLDGAGLKNTGGYIFWDGANQRWLDPAKADARKYLCALAAECAAMGFDEILLTDFTYPTQGKLNKIAYGKDVDRTAQLTLFLTELRQALEPYEVTVSVELPAPLFATGADDTAGLRLADIAAKVDAVYVETSEAEYAALAAKLPETVRLVAEGKTAPVDETVSYLMLP